MKAVRNIAFILILAAAGCISVEAPDENPAVMCMNNLMHLAVEEKEWCWREHKSTNDVPTMADLAKLGHEVRTCPSGGTYKLRAVWKGPTCSIKGHELPKPTVN